MTNSECWSRGGALADGMTFGRPLIINGIFVYSTYAFHVLILQDVFHLVRPQGYATYPWSEPSTAADPVYVASREMCGVGDTEGKVTLGSRTRSIRSCSSRPRTNSFHRIPVLRIVSEGIFPGRPSPGSLGVPTGVKKTAPGNNRCLDGPRLLLSDANGIVRSMAKPEANMSGRFIFLGVISVFGCFPTEVSAF